MSILHFWRWVPAWHWVLPALALAIVMVTIGARLVLAEERRRLDGVEWDEDWQREPESVEDADQLIADLRDDTDLPGPATNGKLAGNPDPTAWAGEHHEMTVGSWIRTRSLWDEWWAELDGLERECLLVTRWTEREASEWAALVGETYELCPLAMAA